MNRSPRLIAVDLDGTLLNEHSEVSVRTEQTLAKLHRAGHHVVAVTGRSWRTAVGKLRGVSAIERIIGSNGAYEYSCVNQDLRWSVPVGSETAEDWCELLRGMITEVSFGWESTVGIHYEPRFVHEAGGPQALEQGGAPVPLSQHAIYKLYIRCPQLVRGELQQVAQDLLGATAEIATSGAPFVEATAGGVDKGSALMRLAGELGIARTDVVAFGDNLNDLPMLRVAGVSVAMGNAVDAVKRQASVQAERHDADGVAQMLEQWMAMGEL